MNTLKDSVNSLHSNGVVNTLLESMAEGIIVVDSEGKIVFVNDRFTNILGFTKEEIVGENINKLIPNDFKSEHSVFMKDYFKNPKIRAMGLNRELSGYHKSGKLIPLEISLSYMPFKEGLFGFAFITDITERQKMQDELKERNKDLDSFTRTVAHDLNSIINNIATASNLLIAEPDLDEPDKELMLEKILSSSLKMSSVINELLLFASLNKDEVEYSLVDMRSIISNTQDRIQNLINERNASIKIAENLDASLGVASWLEEVWYNLLSNAVKYGGNPPIINIESAVKEDEIEFYITDNGSGISKDLQQIIITDPEKIRQPKSGGHGYGLSIVKRIINKLSGQLYVSSDGKNGTTFSFTLPKP